jgi:transcriptional regulator with XRE-family HTH domain
VSQFEAADLGYPLSHPVQITQYLADEDVLAELGARLVRVRLERNLTQRELAAAAGVGRKAVQRVEGGESVTLTSLVRLLRALGLLEQLERLIPATAPGPIELLQARGQPRRRASGERGSDKGSPARRPGSSPWRWGDEAPDELP